LAFASVKENNILTQICATDFLQTTAWRNH